MTDELFAFLNTLLRFKEEIEDRIPEYFTFHHLNLFAETAEFSHYYAAIATVLGIDIRTVSAMEDLNPIEEVLHPRLRSLNSASTARKPCFRSARRSAPSTSSPARWSTSRATPRARASRAA